MKPRLAGVESAGFIRPVQWLARGARGGSGTETMGTSALRMGIAGCGAAARIHLDRLLAQEEVAIVGRADPDLSAARALADRAAQAARARDASIPVFEDHRELP